MVMKLQHNGFANNINSGSTEIAGHPSTGSSKRLQPKIPHDTGRSWQQWHTSSAPSATRSMELELPKKPQWGRYIYLFILACLILLALRAIYLNIFWFNADGIISGRQSKVAPVATVTVEEVLVSPSEEVTEGQLLVKLSSPELLQSLAKNEAEIARIEGELLIDNVESRSNSTDLVARKKSLQAEMDYYEEQYYRETRQIESLRNLVNSGAVQRGHLDQMEIQHSKTWSEYKRIDAELESVKEQLADVKSRSNKNNSPNESERLSALRSISVRINEQLEALNLRAPTAGVVASVPVTKGDVLKAGEPAVVVVDNNDLKAYLYFPAAAQGKIEKNMVLAMNRPDGSKIDLVINKVYPAMEAIPDQFRTNNEKVDSVIVVEAIPAEDHDFPEEMTSGTPIEGRIPRWEFAISLERGTSELSKKLNELADQVKVSDTHGQSNIGEETESLSVDKIDL